MSDPDKLCKRCGLVKWHCMCQYNQDKQAMETLAVDWLRVELDAIERESGFWPEWLKVSYERACNGRSVDR